MEYFEGDNLFDLTMDMADDDCNPGLGEERARYIME